MYKISLYDDNGFIKTKFLGFFQDVKISKENKSKLILSARKSDLDSYVIIAQADFTSHGQWHLPNHLETFQDIEIKWK